jgi:catechol 2,3-dioxygenase-like lactoylglutathione lyase family enzyme
MSTIGDQSNDLRGPSVQNFDLKMEVVVLPVSDVDRAKEFYEKLGWRLDADRIVGGDFRLVQFTPHGSACSIQFGTNLTSAAPGSAQALLLIVPDIDTARDELARRGIEISGVYHCATGTACRFKDGTGIFERVNGLAPDRASYSSFASFSDPDGNSWILQEVTARLAGRVDPTTTSFTSVGDLESALVRTATAHGKHEKRIGHADPDWPAWYARYMVAEQNGTEPPS